MTKIQEIHQTALHLREGARRGELPGYAEKFLHAARDLEELALELERKSGPKPAN